MLRITEFAAVEAGLDDDYLAPLHDAVLMGRKAVRLQTCARARRAMQINGSLMLLYSLDTLRLLPGTEGSGAKFLLPLIIAPAVIGIYLVSRPLPRYPLRSAIGSVLVAGGGIWLALASITDSATWVLMNSLLPWVVADFLTELGAHEPKAGVLVLSLGVWATATGTWQRQERRGLALGSAVD